MGNIVVGGKYLPIPRDHFIIKVHSKVSDTVDEINVPDVIGWCNIAGKVLDEESRGKTFIHCGADKFAKDFFLERSENDGMINYIGC